jgi:hypothetical protein
MKIWMDGIERKVAMEYLFLKGYWSKLIHKELVSTLQANVMSLSTVKNGLRRFKSGDLSCGNEDRLGRCLISLARLFSHC